MILNWFQKFNHSQLNSKKLEFSRRNYELNCCFGNRACFLGTHFGQFLNFNFLPILSFESGSGGKTIAESQRFINTQFLVP